MRFVNPHLASYVTLYMVSPENGQKQYQRYIYGAGRPHLSFEQLKVTAVMLPPLAEQNRIVAEVERRLSLLDGLETSFSANLSRADRLRRAILKRAFEGKLVPGDTKDGPAQVLLNRIKEDQAPSGRPPGSPRKSAKHLRKRGAPIQRRMLETESDPI